MGGGGVQAHMKRIIGNPSQSTMGLNDLATTTNVFDGTIINVISFSGVENENATSKKKPSIKHGGKKIENM
jgi:hypothetical protein